MHYWIKTGIARIEIETMVNDNVQPLVSIGIPTFNRPVELRHILQCMLDQTYANIEIIILDNCSTLPEVGRIAQEFTQKYANIKYFRNAENLGVLRNAVELLKYANGEYFCWVSDDDWRAPEFLDILVAELESNKTVDLAFCDYHEVHADGSRAPGYPSSHLPIFKPYENRFRLVRTLFFYWQNAVHGKCNIFYAVFRKTVLTGMHIKKITEGYRHLNMDCLIVYSLLQRGPVSISKEVLCTLTCGNKKHYIDDDSHLGRSNKPILSKLMDFWLDHKKDRDLYIKNTDRLVEKLIIYFSFFPKVLVLLATWALKKYSPSSAHRANTNISGMRNKPQMPMYAIPRQDSNRIIKLPNVTLVAMATRNVEETLQALIYSCQGIEFGSVKLLSHYSPYSLDKNIEFVRVKKIKNIDEWSYKIVYELVDYIDTEFALLVHADGFVVNPSSWRQEFIEYDYIGAPWPLPSDDFSYRDAHGNIVRVGNSVSLRSKRLLALPGKLNLPWEPFHGFYNEDGFICVKNRSIYESHGMKFAPLDVAKYFSHESMIPEVRNIKPFAFHKWAGSNHIYPKF